MTELRLSDALVLPADAVTHTSAVLGQRGSGKTHTAGVLIEEIAALAPFVVVDPTGAWYGLRSAADGKAPGLSVVVLGGHHGDAPLEETAGHLVADLATRERYSLVLDLELLRKGQQIHFVADFLEALYHANRDPLHVVIDEAQRFAPQNAKDAGGGFLIRCLGAVEDIVKLGRRKGLGATVITQRPASLNKEVLEQTETLIVHRLQGPRDRKAIADWFEAQGDPPGEAEALRALPTLRTGEAYVLSPAFLSFFGRIQVRKKRTFDSSETPKIGSRRREPVGRADIDLAALRERLATAIEKAKADDPKALRQRIVQLERDLALAAKQTKVETKVETKIERVEVPLIPPDVLVEMQLQRDAMDMLGDFLTSNTRRLDELIAIASRPTAEPARTPTARAVEPPPFTFRAKPPTPTPALPRPEGVTGPQQRILDALASFEALGIRDVARNNVAVFSNASSGSSAFSNNLGALRTAGLIDYPASGRVALTDCGRDVAQPSTPITEVAQLHGAWFSKLTGPQGRILRVLIPLYPEAIDREDLAPRAGASAGSSAYSNNLGALRSLGLIDYPTRGQVSATALLFPDGVPA